jgi:hypothetical protein
VYGGLTEGNESILSVAHQTFDSDLFDDDLGLANPANKFPDEPYACVKSILSTFKCFKPFILLYRPDLFSGIT